MSVTNLKPDSARPAPTANNQDAPKNDAKKPQDNTAAKQAPKETGTAVQNTFGGLPNTGNAKKPALTLKTPVTAPSAHTTDGPDSGPKVPDDAKAPGDPKALPDPKAAPDPNAAPDPKASAEPKTSAEPESAPAVPGAPVSDTQGNPLKTPDNRAVVYNAAGNPIAVESDGRPTADPKGNPYAVDKTGKYVETVDGKYGVYDANNNLVATDPATGTVHTDPNGNPYAVTPEGNYVQDANGNYVVHDKANGDNLVAIDTRTSNAVADSSGRPLALDERGNYLKTPEGYTVVYDKINGKSVAVSTDQDGNTMVLYGKPLAIGKDGAPMLTPDGNRITYDKRGNPIPVDQDGKAVTDPNGNIYALTREGKYVLGTVYDKSTGFRMQPGANAGLAKNGDGLFIAIDDNGNVIKNERGDSAYVDARGRPVFMAESGKAGMIYKDAKTGELETQTPGGAVYRVDPATKDIARDEQGKILPALYNPIDDDPTRPPVKPNDNPATTLDKLPKGSERGDPMQIKGELFDEYGNLDVDRLVTAAGKYDARDIYDALINAGKSGGWNNLNPKLPPGAKVAHPNEAQSREVIAAVMAWQNENGHYSPLKEGKVPAIVFGTGGSSDHGGFAYPDNLYINMDHPTGSIATSLFHELNHMMSSQAFTDTYNRTIDGVLAHDEIITETLSNNWSGNDHDTGYEKKSLTAGFNTLNDAILKMGDGDRNKGMDILKRAYFAGEPEAFEKLKEHFSPKADILDYKYPLGLPDVI